MLSQGSVVQGRNADTGTRAAQEENADTAREQHYKGGMLIQRPAAQEGMLPEGLVVQGRKFSAETDSKIEVNC